MAFLGHVISEAKLEMQDDKATAIGVWQTTKYIICRSFVHFPALDLILIWSEPASFRASPMSPHRYMRYRVRKVSLRGRESRVIKERLSSTPVLGMPKFWNSMLQTKGSVFYFRRSRKVRAVDDITHLSSLVTASLGSSIFVVSETLPLWC